jgi:transposase-like protein
MRRFSRLERAETRVEAERPLAPGQTLRQVAAECGIARSTLQDWRRVKATQTAALAAYVATPEGVGWCIE